MLATPRYDQLLLDLYRSTIDPAGLQAFLHGLCAATHSHTPMAPRSQADLIRMTDTLAEACG